MAAPDAEPGAEAYADDAPLLALFDKPAKTRLISVFVAERGRDLSKSELARQAGLSRSSVYEHLDDLLALGVVEHSRDAQGGYSPRYMLAEDSDISQQLYQLEGVTLRRLLELDGTEEPARDD